MRKMISVCCIVLVVLFAMAGCGKKAEETVPTTVATEPVSKELSVTDLLKAVVTLKGDLKDVVEHIEEEELAEAEKLANGLFGKTQTIRESMTASLENLGDSMPSLRSQLENIQEVLNLVDMLSEDILLPAIHQLQEKPFKLECVGSGVHTGIICEYLDFMESLMPGMEDVVQKANSVDLSILDRDGDYIPVLEKANGLLELYQGDSAVFDRLKAVLGAEGDRVYLIAAQNTAEIRASGGFPGAMGVMRIQDGMLQVEDFIKVYDMLSYSTPGTAKVTNEENQLFHGGLVFPRDADYCPDFERVAEIWALGYEARQKEVIDGVISVTPAVVQKLLAVMDEEIHLFDGTKMNGKNAMKVIEYDLYYTYFGRRPVNNGAVVADQLFADAAKKTMDTVMGNMGMENMMDYLGVAMECFDDRTLMLWAAEEGEQAILRAMDWHGGLNSDPQKPQAGVYYSCTVASKMGIFLAMDTEMGERVQNEDGSYTYPITVTVSNNMTKAEIDAAGAYITGGTGGWIHGSTYFFAPAGGTVSDFTASNGLTVRMGEYHDLQLGYMLSYSIQPGGSVTFTYNLTTAPGVEAVPEFSTTPTMQEYR